MNQPKTPIAVASNPFVKAKYVISAHRLQQLPVDEGFEVAVAGRSNAGKSSAVNAITTQNALARISKTPGRTQQLVVFELDQMHRLIDLPGYGYAKVPSDLKEHWHKTLEGYFQTRQCLNGLLLAMDIRHPLTDFDQQMLDFCAARGLACHVLLTKADKLSRSQGLNTLRAVRTEMQNQGINSSVQRFSAPEREGVEEAREVLKGWLDLADPVPAPLPGKPVVDVTAKSKTKKTAKHLKVRKP